MAYIDAKFSCCSRFGMGAADVFTPTPPLATPSSHKWCPWLYIGFIEHLGPQENIKFDYAHDFSAHVFIRWWDVEVSIIGKLQEIIRTL